MLVAGMRNGVTAVWRFLENGRLDTGFYSYTGTQGYTEIDMGGYNRGLDIAAGNNGEIYVTGTGYSGYAQMFLVKYKDNCAGCFASPTATATKVIEVFVIDSGNHRIQVFDIYGNFKRKWGSVGSLDGQFFSPSDVALNSMGEVFVSDTNNHRIQVFDQNGNFLRKWTVYWTSSGTPGVPSGLVCDSNDNVYVVNNIYGGEVIAYDLYGNFQRNWFGIESGEYFDNPTGIDADSDDYLYICDSRNYYIKKYDIYGNYLIKWQAAGDLFNYQAVCVGNDENVYGVGTTPKIHVSLKSGVPVNQWDLIDAASGVANFDNLIFVSHGAWVEQKIKVYNFSGDLLYEWGTPGDNDGQFNGARGIAISK